MNYSFATAQEAADVAAITPEDIGVPGNHFVRKSELVATGKFDADSLSAYQDKEFVLLRDIAQGAFQVSLTLNSDVVDRGTVQINNGAAGSTANATVNVGEEVTVKCNLNNEDDVFDGWYNGAERVSTQESYSFTVESNVSLTAKIFYLEVEPSSLDFTADGGEKTVTVSTNITDWTVS